MLSCNNFFLNSCQKLLQPTFSGPLTAMSDRSFRPRPRSFAASPPSGASSTSSAPTGTASETCAGGPCPAEGPTSARIRSRSSPCQTRTPPLDDSGTATNGENHAKTIRPTTPVPQSQRSPRFSFEGIIPPQRTHRIFYQNTRFRSNPGRISGQQGCDQTLSERKGRNRADRCVIERRCAAMTQSARIFVGPKVVD